MPNVSRGPVKWSLLERSRCLRAIHRIKREQRGNYYGTDLFHICFDGFATDFIRPMCAISPQNDATANYLETKVQMEQVMDSARRVNQAAGKGDSQAKRLWTALRASINDLARC